MAYNSFLYAITLIFAAALQLSAMIVITILDTPERPVLAFFIWLYATITPIGMFVAYKFVNSRARLTVFTLAVLLLVAGHSFYLHAVVGLFFHRDEALPMWVGMQSIMGSRTDTGLSVFHLLALVDEVLVGGLGSLALLALVTVSWHQFRRGEPLPSQDLEKKAKSARNTPKRTGLDGTVNIETGTNHHDGHHPLADSWYCTAGLCSHHQHFGESRSGTLETIDLPTTSRAWQRGLRNPPPPYFR